jgi:H+-transporting ATPase
LVLTVAAIPVAMPTVLSVTMAVGARLLAKKQAIVSKLVAIEELAGVDILCADKTGTLTQNKLTLGDPFCVNGIPADQVILDGALASRSDNNDTIDLAVIGGLKNKEATKDFQVTHFMPFDPVHKRTEASVKDKDGKEFKVSKGAPQVIMKLSANAGQVKPDVDKAVNEFAARGFRSLGVARAEGNGPWQLVGVLPLFDPPRDDAKETIATALKMGVKIKMVTGDALAIAKETAKKLDMGTNILDAAALGDTKKEESDEVAKEIEKADGFAQVFPEHKFHIVDVLQKHGHLVGMTGDGVNDAPALKKADCGIAVSGATDAARAAAAIVLLTPGLSVIIDAIKESRRIFQRMNSYAIYRIAETLRVLFFMTLAILVFNFYPLTAVMIVMLALLNDGAILSIAYDNVKYKAPARGLEHAHGARDFHRTRCHWGGGGVRIVLPGRACLSSRPSAHPDVDVSEVVSSRTSDDFPDAHARTILVHTSGADFVDGRARHSNGCDLDRSVWSLYDASRLEVGRFRVGLCAHLVPHQ